MGYVSSQGFDGYTIQQHSRSLSIITLCQKPIIFCYGNRKIEERHPEVVHLVTGHFHETAGYATWRARGTTDWLLIATLGGGGRFGHAGG